MHIHDDPRGIEDVILDKRNQNLTSDSLTLDSVVGDLQEE